MAATTVIVNAGSDAVDVPSDTDMTMPGCAPTAPDPGVPLNRPVDALKLAQPGFPLMLKESACPSGSDAVGRNEYALPAVTAGAGEPLMTGSRLSGGGGSPAETMMSNAGSELEATPSDTEITTPANVPTSLSAGVPESSPLSGSKLVHDGRLSTLKDRTCPSGSEATGVNV